MQDKIFGFVQQHFIAVALFVMLFLLVAFYDYLFGKVAKFGINVSKLVHLINDKQVLIIDLRPTEAFAKAHIANAINIPLVELTQAKLKTLNTKQKKIVLVANSHQEAFKKINVVEKSRCEYAVLLHGMVAWQQSMPTVSNKKNKKIKN